MSTAREQFKAAVISAHEEFAKRKRSLRDLSPRFWAAWMDLEMALEWDEPFDAISKTFQTAYKQFGAPGDFGYGTPHGEALKAVYGSWSAYCNEQRQAAATV